MNNELMMGKYEVFDIDPTDVNILIEICKSPLFDTFNTEEQEKIIAIIQKYVKQKINQLVLDMSNSKSNIL